MRIKSIGLFIS